MGLELDSLFIIYLPTLTIHSHLSHKARNRIEMGEGRQE